MSVKFAILGHGVVGSGVAELFCKNKTIFEKKAGTEIELKHILDLRDFPDSPYADKFTKDFNDILNDDEVTAVCECMGGLEPAYTFVRSCLEKGKSVSTSNKELVAEKGDILLAIAKENNCNFFFEASVGGAIPIIRPLYKCLAANQINSVSGILNGTTNFILTKMYNDNMAFEDALRLAQELGYAEKDPTADVEGHDACRKICIISSLVYGKHVYPKSVYTKGISQIDLNDVQIADSLGYAIKLIANVRKLDNGKILPCVMPMLVPHDSIISSVSDVFNAVLVDGDAVDKAMFYGRGAGKFPTASAVAGDLINSLNHDSTVLSQSWESYEDDSFIESIDSFTARWYFRASDCESASAEKTVTENGVSFITDDEMSFKAAKIMAEKLGASAMFPVLK